MEEAHTYLCPRCSTPLVPHQDNEALWCNADCEKFDRESLERLRVWRAMSLDERVREINNPDRDVLSFYGLTEEDLAEVRKFAEQREAAIVFSADVAPDKEALLSLARGLSASGALREMIDNSLDCAQRKRDGAPVCVAIELNADKGYVRVTDDAGGMTRDELVRCLKLGAQAPDGHGGNVIGKFGVGAKEAIYHFGREVTISTCDLQRLEPLDVFVPASWLEDPKWVIEMRHGDAIPGTTKIRIGVLDTLDFDKETIVRELWETYSRRVTSGRLTLRLDGEDVTGPPDPIKLFPPELYPRKYNMMVSNVMVDVEVSILDDAPEASGIFFYTFGRRFAHWTWSDPLTRTIFEKPPQHRLNTHFQVTVDFQGNIDDVPINSNKDQVDTTKYAFRPLARIISKIASPYLTIISWLSKDSNMSYLHSKYAGPEKVDSSIGPSSPGFTQKIELGKIFETMQLSRPRIADPEIFYSKVLASKEVIAKPIVETRDTIKSMVSVPLVPEPREPVASDERKNGNVPGLPATTMLISLLTDDKEKVREFRESIAKVAKDLGLKHKIS